MKITLLALSLVISMNAAAQDRGGRQRQPPGTGTNQGGGTRSGGNQGGSHSGGNGGGSTRNDHPAQNGGSSQNGGGSYDGGSSYSGSGARRRVPRPDSGTMTTVQGSRTSPGTAPSQGPDGSSLGHAVRRDSLPPNTGNFGGLDPRGWNDGRDRGGYYWHEYYGHRWCHHIDAYGDDWYYWYYGNDYYTMRYIDGRWWRYDGRYGRWVWFYDDGWYYQDGSSVYYYDQSTGGYQDAESGSGEFPTYEPPKVAVTANIGHFGLVSGGPGSVVNENQSYLNFDGAVGGVSAAAEVNLGINKYLEAGLGVGYVNATANSTYRDYVRDDGSEIRQQTRFQNVPMNVNLKLMPWGRDKQFQPYVGAGVQVNKWNYEESGQFIDFASENYDIYKDAYKAGGVAVGPVAIAGLRIPLNKTVSLNGEYRHQWAAGALPAEGGFAGDHIDLGGNTFQAGVTINLK